MGFELAAIADDLTGGMMIASLLEREGVTCPLITSVDQLANIDASADAVVFANKFRIIPAEDAKRVVKDAAIALRDAGARRLYYKYCATFDSTDKGNIGPCGEMLMEAMGADRMVFCPAFPEYSVTVFQGRMFLGSYLMSETFKQHDPVTPMKDANLVNVLQRQSNVKVGLLSHGALHQGREAAEASIEAQIAAGTRFFIVDAVDDDDVMRCAELVGDWACTSGADAMPMFLARVWQKDTEKKAQSPRHILPPAPGHEVILAGSCAPATLSQLDYFEARHPLFRIDLLKVSEVGEMVSGIAEWAKPHMDKGPIGVATSVPLEDLKRIQAELGVSQAAQFADEITGKVARALYDLGARKFVVAGGETSGQVFASLGIKKVEVSSFDDLSGGHCHANEPEPISLLLKAGGIGGDDLFFRGLDRMRSAENS
jgi:uncharacterized protein YgbK (DUF1537 family)